MSVQVSTREAPGSLGLSSTRTRQEPVAAYTGARRGELLVTAPPRSPSRLGLLLLAAALHTPASRGYYERCRARGKTHTQALLRLARYRIGVLFATLRDGTFYEPRTPQTA